jgi:hypothetical protein
MNWARDDAQLSDADLSSVFKYDSKESTVVRLLASHDVCVCVTLYLYPMLTAQWKADISSLEGTKGWSQFIENVS